MKDLLLLTAFVFIMAYIQARFSKKALRFNSNLTTTQSKKIDNGIYMTIAMIVMMILAMFRASNIGNDTAEYQKIFINIISDPDYVNTTRYEIGYIFLNILVGKFTTNPQGIIIVTALICYPVYIWFIKKHSRNYSLSLLLFFIICFGATMNIIRQQLSIIFILVAYDRVIRNKNVSAYIWVFIACLFHSSAIIFVIMPILPYLKFNNLFAVFLTFFVILLTVTNALFRIFDIIAPQYSHYFGGQYVGTGILAISYQLLRNVAFFIIIFFVIRKIKDGNHIAGKSKLHSSMQNNLVSWLIFVSVVGLIFGYRINLIDRIITYFNTFYIIFIPNALKKFDKNSKKVLTFAIVIVMIMYSIIVQLYRPEWNTIYPYQFFWQ